VLILKEIKWSGINTCRSVDSREVRSVLDLHKGNLAKRAEEKDNAEALREQRLRREEGMAQGNRVPKWEDETP
jgi:hypothetical protein